MPTARQPVTSVININSLSDGQLRPPAYTTDGVPALVGHGLVKACPHWQQIVAENGNKLLPEFVAENGNKLLRKRATNRQQIVAVSGNNLLPKMATKLPVWTGLYTRINHSRPCSNLEHGLLLTYT